MDRDKARTTLMEALHEAGALIRASLQERNIVARKSELSLVTATDTAAENKILKIIQDRFPDHAILAEESLGQGSSPYRWIIDPLDGTTNFAHTFPICMVSIGFEENGVVTLGGTFNPFHDELFFAEKDKGATLNGQPIHVSANASLSESLLATGFPYDRKKKADLYLAPFKAFMMECHGIRRTGSAAADLCYLACGRFDGFWESYLNPWDLAAATLVVREAGGKLTDFAGGPFSIEGTQTLATNSAIHEQMLEVLSPFKTL